MKNVSNDFINEMSSYGKQYTCEMEVYQFGKLITENDRNIITEDELHYITTESDNENNYISVDPEEIFEINPICNGNLLKSNMKALNFQTSHQIRVGNKIRFSFTLQLENTTETIYSDYYYITEREYDEASRIWSYVSYDAMLFSMIEYTSLQHGTFPMTVETYLSNIALDLGLTYTSSQFANYNRTIASDPYKDLGYTYREILDEISAVAGGCVITVGKELQVKYPSTTNQVLDERWFKDINVGFSKKYGPVNSLVLSRSAESDNVYINDPQSIEANGLCEIKIVDNQIMNGNDRADYLQAIFDKLEATEYYINDFESPGIMYLDFLDYYTASIDGFNYKCLILNDEITLDGGISEHIYTEEPEQTTTDYTKADITDRRIKRAYLIVDKINGEISSVVEDLGDLEQATSSLVQNSTEILSTVTYVDNNKNNINNISTIDQKADNILLEVKTIANDNLIVNSNVATGNFNSWTVSPEIYSNVWQGYDKYWINLWNSDTSLRWYGAWQDIYTNVIENTKYTVSFEAFCANVSNNKLRIDVHNNDASQTMLEVISHTFDLTTTPDRYSFTFTSHAGTKMFSFLITSTDYVAFDFKITNIKLEQGEYVTPWIESTADRVKSMINISPEDVLIQANKINLTANDIINLIAGNTINLTSKNIVISSTNFSVDANGNMTATNATITGTVTATSGSIGGWIINADSITRVYNDYMVYVGNASNIYKDFLIVRTGTEGNYNYPFVVNGDGRLYASSATITGNITATSGSFHTNDSLANIDLNNGRIITTDENGYRGIEVYGQHINIYSYNMNNNLVGYIGSATRGIRQEIIIHSDYGDSLDLAWGDINGTLYSAITINDDNNGMIRILSSIRIENDLNMDGHNMQNIHSLGGYNGEISLYSPFWIEGASGGGTGYTGWPMHGLDANHKYNVNWSGTALDFYVDSTYIGTLSDRRLKKDIHKINETKTSKIDKLLEAIDECEIYQFKLPNREVISFGIMAQDLIEACKKRNIDNLKEYEILQDVVYNLEDKETYWKIDYTQYLILKTESQQRKLNNQQSEINELKAQIKEIKEMIKCQ